MTVNFHPEQPCPICGSEEIGYWGSAPDIGIKGMKHDLTKCCKCTHLFVHPLPTEEYLVKAYSESDPSVYPDNQFFENRSSVPFTEADKWVWKHVFGSSTFGNFLDIGSTNLTLLKHIIRLGWRLTAVEPGAHADHIRKNLRAKVCRNVFEECNFQNKFDIIAALDVLEHVNSPVRFLQRVRSCLSDKGTALFRFPNSRSLRCRIERENWNMIRPLGHLHYFTPRSIRKACTISQLKILSLRSLDLARYQFFTFRGRSIRGLRYLWPMIILFNLTLLGDQLLLKVAND